MSKSPTSLLKDHDVRLAIYRLLLVLSSGFERQTKRTIALSKILVRKNITTPDEIDAIEKEFAAFVAVETALDGLTQAQMAGLIRVPLVTVRAWEAGPLEIKSKKLIRRKRGGRLS